MAAMLGCTYDELRQRTRQYEKRRKTLILGASFCTLAIFLGFMTYSNIRISNTNALLNETNSKLEETNTKLEESNNEVTANLNQALYNQSRYLAAESKKALENGDRLLAVKLALESLGAYSDEDRPVVSAAVSALNDAEYSYMVSQDIVPTGSFTTIGTPSIYFTDTDENLLYIADSADTVTIWDTETYELKVTINPGLDYIDDLFLIEDTYLLAVQSDSDGKVICYQAENGQKLWQSSYDEEYLCFSSCTPDNKLLLVFDQCLEVIDPADGSVIKKTELSVADDASEDGSNRCFYFFKGQPNQNAYEENTVYLACGAVAYIDEEYIYYPAVIDFRDYSVHIINAPYGSIEDICITADNKLLVMGYSTEADFYLSDAQYGQQRATYTDEREILIDGYDVPVNFEKTSVSNSNNTFIQTSVFEETEKIFGTSEMVYSYGDYYRIFPSEDGCFYASYTNYCDCRSLEDGSLIKRGGTSSEIRLANWYNNKFFAYTLNGYAAYFGTTSRFTELQLFVDDIDSYYDLGKTIYVHQNASNQILQYSYYEDENFTACSNTFEVGSDDEIYLNSNGAVITPDGGDIYYYLDSEKKEVTYTWDVADILAEDENAIYYRPLGFGDDDNNMIFVFGNNLSGDELVFKLLLLNTDTGDHEIIELECGTASSTDYVSLQDNKIIIPTKYDGSKAFIAYDLSSKETDITRVNTNLIIYFNTILYSNGMYSFCMNDGMFYLLEADTGEIINTETEVYQALKYQAVNETGSAFAVTAEDDVLLINNKGEIIGSLGLEPASIIKMEFSPYGGLMVLLEGGLIYVYDEEGSLLRSVETSCDSYDSDTCLQYPDEDIVFVYTPEFDGCLVDLSQGEVLASMEDYCGWISSTNELLAIKYIKNGKSVYASFPLYSTQDLIDRGKELIEKATFSEAVLSSYGIG